ncbi:MAG: response regulator [Desulfuromonadales bacterium]|nr:response regulator [Desulfuromonadales bacterium]
MTNILVIDNNHDITVMLETVLSSDTCRVQSVQDGRYGLHVLRRDAFDVVLTDVFMPEPDGFDMIKELNGIQPRPRVIAMTGGTGRLSREYLKCVANERNVQQVLYKPFTVDELLDSIFSG